MKFWGAILEHFGLLFGTKNGQARHQNMIGKTIQKIMEKQVKWRPKVMNIHEQSMTNPSVIHNENMMFCHLGPLFS